MRPPFRALVVVLVTVVATLPSLLVAPAGAKALDLHRGSRGKVVKLLETRLNLVGLLPRAAVDRRYTRTTVRAVKRFQRSHHLRVDGRVNGRTWYVVARAARPKPRPRVAPLPKPLPPLILGHRGAVVAGIAENTLASMQYAVGSVDLLEMDLRLTADRQLVLLHDDTLERTVVSRTSTPCTGKVSDWTLLDLTQNCVTRVGAQPIPTFDEVASYAATSAVSIAPELKAPVITDLDLANFVETVNRHGMALRTFVQSFDPSYLARTRRVDQRLRLVRLVSRPVAAARVSASGATIVAPQMEYLTASGVAAYQRAGLQVWSWTARSVSQLQGLWRMRVNGVFTNIPREADQIYHPGGRSALR